GGRPSGDCQPSQMCAARRRGPGQLSRCRASSKTMSLDSQVAGGRFDPMVGQGVQPIPHDTEVCDERNQESSCWQTKRADARGFTLATKAECASASGSESKFAATAAASDADASEVVSNV